jgi:spore protease
MKKYIRSDLFEENFCADFGSSQDSRRYPVIENDVFSVYRSKTENNGKERFNDNFKGNYITFLSSDIISLCDKDFDSLTFAVARELRTVMLSKVKKIDSVMIVGLGNSSITADSLGVRTIEKITVSAERGSSAHIFAVSVGVSSVTGIEAAEHIKGLRLACKPDIIIAIDALAARSRKRLYSTIQISDAGITPGSGIGNHRTPINEETIGVPVIAIGVPTVIATSTLVCESLKNAGIDTLSNDMRIALEEDKGCFVTSNYCDIEIRSASIMLSQAIELACTGRIY